MNYDDFMRRNKQVNVIGFVCLLPTDLCFAQNTVENEWMSLISS